MTHNRTVQRRNKVTISNKEGQPERGLFGGFAGVMRAKLVSCIAPPVLSSPDTKRWVSTY
eukprot:15343208-Ditylum_brightwellii.AAC.1